jgi:membrane-associated phospholipid phosphatase
MNALLFVAIGLIVALVIGFIIAFAKGSARACIALAVVAVLLLVGLTCTTFIRPQISTWYIGNSTNNVLQLVNQRTREYLTIDLAKVPHIRTEYKADQEVELTRSILGAPIFVSPKLWTEIPK